MSIRAFFAFPIPDGPAARLKAVQRGVYGAKWRPRDNFHVTLRFLDQISHEAARELDSLVAGIRRKPFEIALKGAGWFGGAEPRALWIGVERTEPLLQLADAIDRACHKLRLPPRAEKYLPHVTLAYCAGTTVEDAAKFAERLALFRVDPFLVDSFGLYSSWQTKRLNRYEEEATYPLEERIR